MAAAALALVLTLSVTACGSSSKENSSKSSSETGPVTLTILLDGAQSTDYSTYLKSSVVQEMLKKTGVILKLQYVDDNKYNVLLAGGDLPDIIRAKPSQFKQLINGGNVIPMDDLLNSYGKDVQKTIPSTIEISKKYWSAGKNKLYFLPAQVQTNSSVSVGQTWPQGFVVRWDWYKELGYPTINNMDDALNVLAKMVKNHPKTSNGKKIYGVSAWSDWGIWPYQHPLDFLSQYVNVSSDITEFDYVNNKVACLLTDDQAPYWQSVDYYHKANKLGILDPDFFTQKNDDYADKAQNGQLASIPATWWSISGTNNSSMEGYMSVALDWGGSWSGAPSPMGWSDKAYGITKSCKYPEKAMAVLNYLWSYEGCRTQYSGVKGTEWDTTDGKPALKDATIKASLDTESKEWKDTGITALGEDFYGLSHDTINPEDGQPLDLFHSKDIYKSTLTAYQKDYCEHYGVEYPGEIFDKKIKEGKIKDERNFDTIASGLMADVPDNIKRLEANLKEMAIKYAAKCILATSDNDYQNIKKQALADFKSSGVDTVNAWYTDAWNTARAESAKISTTK